MKLYLSSFRNGNNPEELLKLLGDGRHTALINNALDFNDPEEYADSLKNEIDRLVDIGLEPVEFDLRKYFTKSDDLESDLSAFDLIWIRGGNAFVLQRALKQSGADKVIAKLVSENKVVYGAYSAGIDVIAPSLHGIELVDDPNVVPDDYDGTEVIWEGMDLIPWSVRCHYRSDHPESAAGDKSLEYMINNHIPFIALRDGQAIVIDGTEQRIVG